MVQEYMCEVTDETGSTVKASERLPLDNIRAAQWASVQLYESVPGDIICIRSQDSGTGTPAGWPGSLPIASVNGLPTGGTVGQVLAKSGTANFAAGWIDAPTGGGTSGGGCGTVSGAIEETDSAFSYNSGTWATITNSQCSGGTCKSDGGTGGQLAFTFTGTRCQIWGPPRGGLVSAELSPGGGTHGTAVFNADAATATSDFIAVLLVDTGVLAAGTYTMYSFGDSGPSIPYIVDYALVTS